MTALRKGGWFCPDCEQRFTDLPPEAASDAPDLATPPALVSPLDGVDLGRLPSIIALPLDTYAREQDPLVRLWDVSNTVELLLRLVVAIGIADVLRANRNELPASLRGELRSQIEEPTLGDWRAMGRALSKHAPKEAVVPELPGFVTRDLEPLLRGPEPKEQRTIENSLAALRNQLAHGGGVTRAVAARLHEIWAPRFAGVLRAGAWLSDIELVTPRPSGPPGVLVGPSRSLRTFQPANDAVLAEVEATARAGGAVVLVRGHSVLSLWPFQHYGLPMSSNPDALRARDEVPQIFARRGLVRLELTPIGSLEVAQSETGEEALASFEALFRAEEAPASVKWNVPGWEDALRKDARDLVGRAAEVETIERILAETATGALWLTGPAGIGKSYLVAKAAMDALDAAREGELVLPFRFKIGDGRCSRAAFLEFARERLLACPDFAQQESDTAKEERPLLGRVRELLGRVGPAHRRVVFVLDGLDEIAASDPEFARDVPLGLEAAGVVWLCSGRPERGLPGVFSPERCRHVFSGGVPRMSRNDIREWLLGRLDFLGRELARSDRDSGESVENPFISAVDRNADGLPIYVRHVLGDVRSRRIQVFDERARLPASLAEYHEELLRRCQVGSLHMVLTPLVCLLGVAREPLSVAALHALLVRWLRISDGADGRQRVETGLGALASMLRLAPTPDGANGYTLFHHSLREHMEASEATRDAMADARRALGDAALDWESRAGNAGSAYLFRWGVTHFIERDRKADAASLLTHFGYLMARLEALGADETPSLVHDVRAVENMAPGVLGEWERFMVARAHLIARGGATALLHAAIAAAETSPVTEAAERWLATGKWQKPWFRRVNRPARTQRSACLMTLEGHSGEVRAVALHRDGLRAVSASGDKTLKLWDLQTNSCLHTFEGHSGTVVAVALHPDGRRAVSASEDETLKLWDLQTGECLRTLDGHSGTVCAVALHPDGRRAVSASADKTVKLWDLETGRYLKTLEGHSDNVLAVALYHDGRHAISAGQDTTLKVWDLDASSCLKTFEGHSVGVTAVALYHDDRRAISAGGDDTLRLWDLETGACLETLSEQHVVWAVALHPDGRHAISASHDTTLKVWDLETNSCLKTFEGHSGAVLAVALHPDGRRAISGSEDETLKLWDLEAGAFTKPPGRHASRVSALALHLDGHTALSVSEDETLKLWDLATGSCLKTLEKGSSLVVTVAILPDGRRVVWACWDGTLELRDLETGACLKTIDRPDRASPVYDRPNRAAMRAMLEGFGHYQVRAVASHPDGRRVLTASNDKTLMLWDLETGSCLKTLEGHSDGVFAVALHPDRRRALSASHDKTLKLWDLETGSCLKTLEGHSDGVCAVALLPDLRHALSASDDKTLKLWDLETGSCLKTLEGHSSLVRAVALHPDGRHAISASHDKTLKVWDLETGEPVANWDAEHDCVCCAIAPNGRVVYGDAAGDVGILELINIKDGAQAFKVS